VAVAFARFLAVVFPPVSESRYLVEPIHISSRYAFSLSTAQLVGVGRDRAADVVQFARPGVGKMVQNLFTTARRRRWRRSSWPVFSGWSAIGGEGQLHGHVQTGTYDPALGVAAGSAFGLIVALCVPNRARCFRPTRGTTLPSPRRGANPRRNLPLAMALGRRR